MFYIEMEIEKETLLLVIVYFMSGYLELPRQHRILIIGDFNFDRMLTENVASVDLSIQNFNLSQHWQYLTHIHGDYMVLYVILRIPMLFLLYHHPTVSTLFFFFQIRSLYLYRI